MVTKIINYCKLYNAKKKWRAKNRFNRTVMGAFFDQKLVKVGDGTYGRLNVINYSDKSQLKIGRFCSIGPDVTFIVCGDHAVDHLSTYPFGFYYAGQGNEATTKGDIIVGDDVWFGAKSIVLSGVSVGRGAVVSAGAIVTKDIPPYAIVAGVPARIIKMRFTQEQIEVLMSLDFEKFSSEYICAHMEQLYKKIEPNDTLEWVSKERMLIDKDESSNH